MSVKKTGTGYTITEEAEEQGGQDVSWPHGGGQGRDHEAGGASPGLKS